MNEPYKRPNNSYLHFMVHDKKNKIGINSHLVVVVVALVVDGTMVVAVVGAVPVVSVLHRFEELFLFGVLHRDRKDSKNSIHNKHQSQIGLLQL